MKSLKIKSNGQTETRFHVDDDSFVIETVQDVQPILDFNHERQCLEVNKKSAFRHAASIPVTTLTEWMKQFKARYGVAYYQAEPEVREKFLKRKLNDRDNSRLRTWQGRL